jgi:hypothetical protein
VHANFKRELPQASHFGFLSDLKLPGHELLVKDAQAAASAIGGSIEVLTASTSGEIDAVFARIANLLVTVSGHWATRPVCRAPGAAARPSAFSTRPGAAMHAANAIGQTISNGRL